MFPTAARIAADGTFTDADIEVAVEIFDSTNEGVARSYVLTGCSIDRSNGGADTVTCTTPEGVGGPFAAAVTITTPYSTGTEICETPKNFAATMVYASPTIDSDGISGDDASYGDDHGDDHDDNDEYVPYYPPRRTDYSPL
jgi:hypothetical protein